MSVRDKGKEVSLRKVQKKINIKCDYVYDFDRLTNKLKNCDPFSMTSNKLTES